MVAAKKKKNYAGVLVRDPDGAAQARGATKRLIAPNVRTGAKPAAATTAPAAVTTSVPATETRTATPAQAPALQSYTDADVKRLIDEAVSRLAPQAPAVHTERGFTTRDLELLALDNGMRGEDVDAWRAARSGELPTVPAGHRFRAQGGRRQYKNMRGSRTFGVSDPHSLGQAAGPDEGVGELYSAWAAYMARGARMAGRVDPNVAFKLAKRDGADPILVRALGESTFIDGGALVPEVVLDSYIELLYASTVFLQGNPLRVTLSNGKISIPRIASGAAASWIGENANITPTQETFDDVHLSLKKLGVIVPYSNDLANHAIGSLAALIRDDMSMNAAIAADTALIRGLGTAYAPRGVRFEATANNIFAANATVNVANVTIDLAKMMRLQLGHNVKGTKWYSMLSPRSLMYLWSARDANNNYVWRDELMRGTLNGKPYGVTTSIPENLGSGSDSEVYLVDMAHELVGEGAGEDGFKFEVAPGAAYHNGSAVVSGFSQDQTVARLIQKIDRASRQNGKNISVLTGVTWA